MNKIKPEYVTFEQAQFLKEKRFNYHDVYEDVADYYDYYDSTVQGRCHYSDFKEELPNKNWIPVPEQHQVVEWLWIKHNIWVTVDLIFELTDVEQEGNNMGLIFQDKFFYSIKNLKTNSIEIFWGENNEGFNSSEEAYSAAFDYIRLNNLI